MASVLLQEYVSTVAAENAASRKMANDALFVKNNKTSVQTKDSNKRRKRNSKDKNSRKTSSSRSSTKLERKQDTDQEYNWTIEPLPFDEAHHHDDDDVISKLPPIDIQSHG